jgi:hypothetical protein
VWQGDLLLQGKSNGLGLGDPFLCLIVISGICFSGGVQDLIRRILKSAHSNLVLVVFGFLGDRNRRR